MRKLVAAMLMGLLFSCNSHAHERATSFGGIGITLGIKRRAITIINVCPGTPAFRTGLSPGLLIRRVDDHLVNVDTTATDEANMKRCADMIRGAPGTNVRLELVDKSKRRTKTVELTRMWFYLP
jgi:carboxyl-terminal processing protease